MNLTTGFVTVYPWDATLPVVRVPPFVRVYSLRNHTSLAYARDRTTHLEYKLYGLLTESLGTLAWAMVQKWMEEIVLGHHAHQADMCSRWQAWLQCVGIQERNRTVLVNEAVAELNEILYVFIFFWA